MTQIQFIWLFGFNLHWVLICHPKWELGLIIRNRCSENWMLGWKVCSCSTTFNYSGSPIYIKLWRTLLYWDIELRLLNLYSSILNSRFICQWDYFGLHSEPTLFLHSCRGEIKSSQDSDWSFACPDGSWLERVMTVMTCGSEFWDNWCKQTEARCNKHCPSRE